MFIIFNFITRHIPLYLGTVPDGGQHLKRENQMGPFVINSVYLVCST